jgi:6-pyruvoyltetrahydropterin/6-carboxytetrahydropterin synthase
MGAHKVTRYHDFSAGHRVKGHESKCRWLHGHNYRIYFTCEAKTGLDNVGRVIDFSVMKERLCQWLEDNWDHRMILWDEDTEVLEAFTRKGALAPSVVTVPFNPTAENMAEYLVLAVGPEVLADTDVILTAVTVEETRKCSATFVLGQWIEEPVYA